MDNRSKITTFEEILMQNPFNNSSSLKKTKKQLETYDFDEFIYPRHTYNLDDLDNILTPPSLIFLPDVKLLRIMVKANLMFSKVEKLPHFLLRFGLIDDTITDEYLYFQFR